VEFRQRLRPRKPVSPVESARHPFAQHTLIAFSILRVGRGSIVFYFTQVTNNSQGQCPVLYRLHDTTAAAVTKICGYCVKNADRCDPNRKHFLITTGMFRFMPVNKDMSQKNCALLGYYAANSGNFIPTFRDNLSAPS